MTSGGGEMNKQKDMEKLFTEKLDSILTGKEADISAVADAEIRSALEFARKMIQLRPSPSAQYSTRLKAGLLQKLDEQEARAKEKKGWSWNILRQPAWQAAVAVIVVILVVSIVWRSGMFKTEIIPPTTMTTTTVVPSTTAPAMTSVPSSTQAPGALLSVSASTGKSTYKPGEKVGVNILMGNSSSQELKLEKLPPILSIMSVAAEKPVYTFAAGKETRTLAPGETAQFNYTWDGLDFDGERVAGRYYIELEDMEYQGKAVKLNLSRPADFEILASPDPDFQTRIIEYYQTQTDNNISVSIKKVGVTNVGFIIEAYITPPPDYAATWDGKAYIADKDYSAAASYSFDGGWVKEVGGSTVKYLQNGMDHLWYILDIGSPEVKELFFHVTDIGSWQGSWQFQIPLE
jgi:hypothetical protein